MGRFSVLSSFCATALSGSLLMLAWQQWQDESVSREQSTSPAAQMINVQPPTFSYLPALSQGWTEEKTALLMLSNAETQMSAALLEQSTAHLQQARKFYRQAVLNRPLCISCQHSLARVAALLVLFPSPQQGNQSGRGTLALTGFQRSLALAPTWPELWEETGKFFLHLWPVLNQDERRFATACLERALLLAPERTEAILAFAFPIDPNLPAAVSSTDPRRGFAAARLYRQHRDSERAHRQARQVAARLTQEVTQDTGAFSSLLLLGEVQLFLGNHKEAKAVYEQGFTRASDPAVRGDFCWHLADWYYDREDYITAGDYYRRYLMLAPDTPEAMLRLGICTLRTGKREEGVRWLERAAGLRLEDAAQRIQLAQAFEEAGRYDRANALYRRLLAQEAQPRPDLLLSLARNYIHLGLQREALSVYQQLLVVDTANAEARMFIDSVGKPRQPAR